MAILIELNCPLWIIIEGEPLSGVVYHEPYEDDIQYFEIENFKEFDKDFWATETELRCQYSKEAHHLAVLQISWKGYR